MPLHRDHLYLEPYDMLSAATYTAHVSYRIMLVLTFIFRFDPSFITTCFCVVDISLIPENLPAALHTNHSPSNFIIFLLVFEISTLMFRVFMYSHIVAVYLNPADSKKKKNTTHFDENSEILQPNTQNPVMITVITSHFFSCFFIRRIKITQVVTTQNETALN